MYFKVTYTLTDKYGHEKKKDALFIDEQAAKMFCDQLWTNEKLTHAEVNGGFDSKGEKV